MALMEGGGLGLADFSFLIPFFVIISFVILVIVITLVIIKTLQLLDEKKKYFEKLNKEPLQIER